MGFLEKSVIYVLLHECMGEWVIISYYSMFTFLHSMQVI
jgi:hypothetical protein